MEPERFHALFPHIHSWIRTTVAHHAGQAKAVASLGFVRLPQYFSAELLRSTRVVAISRVPMPPLSALGLNEFAEFEKGNFAGITYEDTFFVKQDRAVDEALHFHEMIHVVQWRVLGAERFLALYADGLEKCGYRDSPLEAMAYDAEAAFQNSDELFNAEKFVATALAKIAG